MTIRTWGVLALLICAGCGKKKDQAAGTATGSASGSGSGSATAAADPWGSAPPGASTSLGKNVGDDFAKVDPKTTVVSAEALATKGKEERIASLSAIAQPTADKLAIKGFASVDTSTGFHVTYNPSQNAAHENYRAIFSQNHVFENVAEGLNKTVRVPKSVDIQTVDCNTVNAFYDPNSQRIIVCYELLDYFLDVFKGSAKSETELGNAVMGAVMFSFFHEAGHGLIHLLDLPAVGREEDSVDQLATLILIAAGDEGVSMALSGAYWFQLQAKSDNKTPFWDEHAFDGQRFYNILCLIYGSDPTKYAGFVSSGNLPKDRAQRCPEEYAKINKAWEKLLQPHLTNGAAANVDYQPSVPTTEAPQTTSSDPWGGTPSSPTPAAPPATPDPTPAAPAPGVTCEQVAYRAAELIGAEAETRAKTMSAAEIEQLKAELESQLPAAMEQILAACAKEDWSDSARKCVLESKTLDAATKCGT